eukprot:TRINITY_DN17700_c0_g1_i1.p1 TRINITY_DN17700_c0_g1~~TRINITY_DN17700_c0_g1_i1.p1  ORF type:complete len:269 (+),score=71.72 TRINITY_DN17700_c0_g1_i1:52-807(+)
MAPTLVVLFLVALAVGLPQTGESRLAELRGRVEQAEERLEDARHRRRRSARKKLPKTLAEAAASSPESDDCDWDGVELIGKCVANSRRAKNVKSAERCRRRCCGAGIACVAWQYRDDIGCQLMDDTRVGPKEHATRNTDGYCEETAPSPWQGKVLENRDGSECTWGDEALEGQCWGLGPKRPAGKASAKACAAACCADPDCGLWQWRADKGCFYTNKKGQCDKKDVVPYQGARKVIPADCYVRKGKMVCSG